MGVPLDQKPIINIQEKYTNVAAQVRGEDVKCKNICEFDYRTRETIAHPADMK